MILEGLDWFEGGLDLDFSSVELLLAEKGWTLDLKGSHSLWRYRYLGPHGMVLLSGPRMKVLAECQILLPGEFFGETGDFGQEFAFYISQLGMKPCRIDWAVDLIHEIGQAEEIPWPEKFEHRRGHKHDTVDYYDDRVYTGLRNGKSEFVLRCYDKGWEQERKEENLDKWWRIEWVMRGDLSKCQDWGRDWKSFRNVAHSLLTKRFKVKHSAICEGEGGRAKPRSEKTEKGQIRYWLDRANHAIGQVEQIRKEGSQNVELESHHRNRLLEILQEGR